MGPLSGLFYNFCLLRETYKISCILLGEIRRDYWIPSTSYFIFHLETRSACGSPERPSWTNCQRTVCLFIRVYIRRFFREGIFSRRERVSPMLKKVLNAKANTTEPTILDGIKRYLSACQFQMKIYDRLFFQ